MASKITRPTFANFLRHPQKLLKPNSIEKLDEIEKIANPAKKFKKTPEEFKNVTTTIMDVDIKPNTLAGQDETITIQTNQRKSICSETVVIEKDNLTYEVECDDGVKDMLNVTVNIGYPDDTIILSSDTKPVMNSTMNSDRLVDVTQVLPGFMNITENFGKDSTFVNTTDLLCMTQPDQDETLVQRTLDDINEQTKPPDMDMSFDISEEVDRNSTPIDALKQLQATSKPRFSFGLDLTDCTLDCSIELCDASLSSSTANKPLKSPCTNFIKQNSFDMDESLGILTPDQMKEFLDSATTTANLELPLEHISTGGHKPGAHQCRIDQTPSPEDLPLDPVSVKTDVTDVDSQSAPSAPSAQLLYQELSQTDSYSKTDQMTKSAASKVSNSFITSVTSITSLDTGYQGDGEMSRPASRGADHSPSNAPRLKTINQTNQAANTNNNNNSISWNLNAHPPIPRRQEPMTDSDFFTESDADDAINRGGDRRAQIIDGQLYGPMLQAANVFINQQLQNDDSCMDSSGIFTDVDNRGDDDSLHRPINKDDLSPDGSSDTMRSTSSEFRDETLSTPTNQTMLSKSNSCEENNKKVGSSQSLISDASLVSLKSIRNESPTDKKKLTATTKKVSPIRKQNKNEANVTIKKQEMAKRGSPVNRRDENQENKSPSAVCVSVNVNCVVRKPAPNKWDAVMNKIAENKTKSKSKLNLSDIKSKVTTGVTKRSPGSLKSPQSGCSGDGTSVAKRPLINPIKR